MRSRHGRGADNVETFEEKERVRLYQFLGRLPPTCKAILTSRRRTDIDARVIRLDRLELKDALDLMDALAKSNRHLRRAGAAGTVVDARAVSRACRDR
ncbi:MAG: hypothetical protein LC800_09150 [Acidobacteria bacterium]|nr:hypothetical protein [Acidobacteriota bacterium]